MFHTIMVPATLYPAVLRGVMGRFEAVQPTRKWGDHEPSDEMLQEMRRARGDLAEVTAVLDQISWTAIPRDIKLTAEGPLMRAVLTGAVSDTLMAFSRILGATITADTDLDQFELMIDQLTGLTALLRDVQHDHDEREGLDARAVQNRSYGGGAVCAAVAGTPSRKESSVK